MELTGRSGAVLALPLARAVRLRPVSSIQRLGGNATRSTLQPILRLSTLVRDRHNLHTRTEAIHQPVRVTRRKQILPTTMRSLRPTLRRRHHSGNRGLQSQQETTRRERTTLCVPISSGCGILIGIGMPPWLTRNHGKGVALPQTRESSQLPPPPTAQCGVGSPHPTPLRHLDRNAYRGSRSRLRQGTHDRIRPE